jgi:hypothetical protein
MKKINPSIPLSERLLGIFHSDLWCLANRSTIVNLEEKSPKPPFGQMGTEIAVGLDNICLLLVGIVNRAKY